MLAVNSQRGLLYKISRAKFEYIRSNSISYPLVVEEDYLNFESINILLSAIEDLNAL